MNFLDHYFQFVLDYTTMNSWESMQNWCFLKSVRNIYLLATHTAARFYHAVTLRTYSIQGALSAYKSRLQDIARDLFVFSGTVNFCFRGRGCGLR